MARSKYIYVVEGTTGVVAAFTVKHELETWLAGHQPGDDPGSYRIWRVGDGLYGKRPVLMTNVL